MEVLPKAWTMTKLKTQYPKFVVEAVKSAQMFDAIIDNISSTYTRNSISFNAFKNSSKHKNNGASKKVYA